MRSNTLPVYMPVREDAWLRVGRVNPESKREREATVTGTALGSGDSGLTYAPHLGGGPARYPHRKGSCHPVGPTGPARHARLLQLYCRLNIICIIITLHWALHRLVLTTSGHSRLVRALQL